jgi:hypothetical protein
LERVEKEPAHACASEKTESAHRHKVLSLLNRVPDAEAPAGWTKASIAVGGLMYVGFSEADTNKLICISTQKQTVVNCETCEVEDCPENYDELELTAMARALGDEVIRIAGIGGGGLRLLSRSGDSLLLVAPQFPAQEIIFEPDFKSCLLEPEKCWRIYKGYELRAYGFSRCSQYFVIGDSCDLHIFRRS